MQLWSVPKEWSADDPVFIIGGGPSLRGFDFERLRGRGKIIAVNDAGLTVTPWADVLFWADARWLTWNAADLDNFRGKYRITRKAPHARSDLDIKYVEYLPGRWSHWSMSVGGWCGGSSAVNLAYLFGARVIFLLGFDMTPGNWHDRHKLPPKGGQHREKFIPTFEKLAPEMLASGLHVFNCNPRSALRCFPFVTIDEVLSMDDIARIEREKYLAVWERPEYRRISPGMLEVQRATVVCGFRKGHSIIDFGSGPCRASKFFQDNGMHVTAIDFAPNASEHSDIPFVEACLWDSLQDVEQADFGYCCDVMEHIPTPKVSNVLANISRLTAIGTYFRIATRADRMGPMLINQPLHMTVQTGEWWRRKVEGFFPLVDVIEKNDRDIILFARH